MFAAADGLVSDCGGGPGCRGGLRRCGRGGGDGSWHRSRRHRSRLIEIQRHALTSVTKHAHRIIRCNPLERFVERFLGLSSNRYIFINRNGVLRLASALLRGSSDRLGKFNDTSRIPLDSIIHLAVLEQEGA